MKYLKNQKINYIRTVLSYMRLLTKNKQNEALKRILANAIIAYDATMKSDDTDKKSDTCYYIADNLTTAAFAVGGANAFTTTAKVYLDYINKEDKQ